MILNRWLHYQMQNFKNSIRLFEITLTLSLPGAVYVCLHTPITLKKNTYSNFISSPRAV